MKMDEKTGKFLIYVAVIIVGLVVVVKILGGIDSFLEMLGLRDSADKKKNQEKINAANSNSSGSPFNPNLYKTRPTGTKVLTNVQANDLAMKVHDSVGYIYDTPEQAEAAFKQCDSKVKVSQICNAMSDQYDIDAFEWMKRTFDTASQVSILASIVDYCNNLKTY